MAADSAETKKTAKRLSRYSGWAFLASGFFLVCWGVGSLMNAGGLFKALFFLSIIACVGCWIFSKVLVNQSKTMEEQERKDREEKARKESELRDREYALQRIRSVHQRSVDLNQSIPALLQSTSSYLDLADQEYQRGAFSPFWEAIEGATMRLGELSDHLSQFMTLTGDHKQIEKELHEKHGIYADKFPVRLADVYKAEEGQLLGMRMDALVGRAQTNYQFSTIYEQRRTNSILIAGFSSLGNAIYGMTSKLSGELESVVRSVDSVNHSVDAAASASASQSAQALEMLNNIQRRRLPAGQASRREY